MRSRVLVRVRKFDVTELVLSTHEGSHVHNVHCSLDNASEPRKSFGPPKAFRRQSTTQSYDLGFPTRRAPLPGYRAFKRSGADIVK